MGSTAAVGAFVLGGTDEAARFLREVAAEIPGLEFFHGRGGWTITAPAGTDRERFDQLVFRVREIEGVDR